MRADVLPLFAFAAAAPPLCWASLFFFDERVRQFEAVVISKAKSVSRDSNGPR
jgi:hypothetical protein